MTKQVKTAISPTRNEDYPEWYQQVVRHGDLAEMGIEKRHEEGEMTPRERQAHEWGVPYLDLDGNIGMFPGGAGFGIMANAFIHHFGGIPANFGVSAKFSDKK